MKQRYASKKEKSGLSPALSRVTFTLPRKEEVNLSVHKYCDHGRRNIVMLADNFRLSPGPF
jgi:hypothetical protein